MWDHPELSSNVISLASAATEASTASMPLTGFVVDYEGRLQFPFAGKIMLASLTEDNARDLLAHKLARHITNPNIILLRDGNG